MLHKITVKRAIIILLLFAIIGFSAIFYFAKKSPSVQYETQTAALADIFQTVSETGTIKPAKELVLNFQNSGTITKINFKTGDIVKQGEIIAELDKVGLDIQQKQAAASLTIAKANLKKLIDGPAISDINLKKASLDQAKNAYDSAKNQLEKITNTQQELVSQAEKNLNDLISNSPDNITAVEQAMTAATTNLENAKKTYQKAIDDKISSSLTLSEAQISSSRAALDSINKILTDDDLKNLLSAKNIAFLEKTKTAYAGAVSKLTTAENVLAVAKTDKGQSNVSNAIIVTTDLLNLTFYALTSCFSALENTLSSSGFPQASLDAYKATISSQTTLVSGGISSLQTAEQALNSAILAYNTNMQTAQDNLSQAQNNYNNAKKTASDTLTNVKNSRDQALASANAQTDAAFKQYQVIQADYARLVAPARAEDMTLAQGQVTQAQSQLDTATNNLKNAIIYAPIAGTISNVNYEVGEQFSPTKPAISMIGENNLEIEVDISESDISKVKVGNKVNITLDALGEDTRFSGVVAFIDPAQTIIQDVIYYQVKIEFDKEQNLSQIKPGMSANIEISTAQKTNVLAIPLRAVIDKAAEGKFVRILVDKQAKDMKVTTGLLGDDGQIEILSGLNQGDVVIVSTK